MADYKVTDAQLSSIANAIRTKGGTSDPLVFPSGFVSAIGDISAGAVLISKIISANGEYSAQADNADGFSNVVVDVPAPSGSISIESNGTYDVSAFANAVVSVPTGGDNSGVDALMGVNVPADIYTSTTNIRSYAASGTTITGLNAPNVISIGSSAFYNCRSLKTVSMPVCKSVEYEAFRYCTALSEFYAPQLTYVGCQVFKNCTSLESAYLPNVISISSYAFEGDGNLSVVYMQKVSRFYERPFDSCVRLMSVYLLTSSIPTGGYNVFAGTPIGNTTTQTGGEHGSIFVKASMYSAFCSASDWSNYSSRYVSMTDEEIAALEL